MVCDVVGGVVSFVLWVRGVIEWKRWCGEKGVAALPAGNIG